jgi:hypothetical protein
MRRVVAGHPHARTLEARHRVGGGQLDHGVAALMGGLATPAVGQVQPSSPWFGKPGFQIKYGEPAHQRRHPVAVDGEVGGLA